MPLGRRRRAARSGGTLEPVGGTGPLASASRYVVASDVLSRTLEAIQRAGRAGDELFAAWGGHMEDDGHTLRMTSALIPEQECIHSPDGVGVIIGGDALFRLNKELYERGEVLAGQAHAHPTRAYHSHADDELALVTFAGGLSLVVPDFARTGRSAEERWRWYRLEASEAWGHIPGDSVELSA